MSRLNVKRSHLSRLRWLTAASATALVISTVAMAYAGNNPLPSTGAPHATGISHQQYPTGYKLNGQFAPSFNNYLDYSDGAPKDERPFMGARVLSPVPNPAQGFETAKKLKVKPGDTVLVSMYIHNDGGTSGNNNGTGPSVAKNTRVGVNFPTNKSAAELQIGSFIYADNAVVNDQNLSMHTISDNMSFLSETGQAIKLKYKLGSAKLLQSRQAQNINSNAYASWSFSQHQEFMLTSATWGAISGNPELASNSGVSVGHDGAYNAATAVGDTVDQKLNWYGCNEYHGYVQFQVQVEAGPVPSPTPTPTVTPTAPPTPTPTPTPVVSPSPSPSPSATPTPTATPTPPAPSEVPTPPAPPEQPPTPAKGVLPVTGTSTMALLSALALAISGYLYIRERKALQQAIARYTVGK